MIFVGWKYVVMNTDWIQMEVCSKESCRNEIDLQARNAIKGYLILHTCNMFTGPMVTVMMIMMMMMMCHS